MDFFKELFKFFTDKEYSFASKFIGLIVILFVLFTINNLLGFSFYYSTNQKITQISNIETLKKECKNNPKLLNILVETENEIINRKNLIENFFDLFSKEPYKGEAIDDFEIPDTVFIYDTVLIYQNSINLPRYLNNTDSISNKSNNLFYSFSHDSSSKVTELESVDSIDSKIDEQTISIKKEPLKYRSKLWHTVSSSYLLILLMLILPIIPFTEKKFSWSTLLGMIFLMVFNAGFIWLNQFLLGLIPVVLNNPAYNYILNFILHTGFWGIIIIVVNRNNKKKKSLKD